MEVLICLFSNSFPGKPAVAACKPLIASKLGDIEDISRFLVVVTAFAQQSDRVLLRAWVTLTIVDVMARSRERLSNHIEIEMI